MNTISLKHALWGNAVFSTTCAILLLGLTQPLATVIGSVPQDILIFLGLALAAFAAQLLWVAAGKPIKRALATAITAADAAWVIATPVILILFPNYFTEFGNLILVIVAGAVGCCAILQYRALTRLD